MSNDRAAYFEKIKRLEGPIFVFGASGFIGSNLLSDILQVRDDCYALTHDATKAWRLKIMNIPFERIIHCDIVSPASVREALAHYRPKTIFNLAAYGAYSKQSNVSLIYETNLIGAANILELCTKDMVYVHAGSSSEYGFNSNQPKEMDKAEPNSHYAVSKVSSAYLVDYYAKVNNIKAVNLRLYAIYGAWEEPDRLIPRLIENVRNHRLPKLVAREISRDFVYIDDCNEAFIDVALKIGPKTKGKSYNVATGRKTTIEDLVNLSRATFHLEEKPVWGSMENRKWDMADWFGDPAAIEQDFGWKAKTSLNEGLVKYKEWQDNVDYENTVLPAYQNPKLNPIITAIIACYKDAQAIPFMYKRLVKVFNELKVRYEIIFVNDSSPDNQEEVIEAICNNDPQVIGITHSRNFGSQSAFLSGMEIATGNAVVLMDGDLQDPPEVIPQFYEKWNEGFDVVYGVRVQREMKPRLHFFYKTFYRIFQKLSYVPIPRDAGDFSLIDRKVVKELVALPETEQFLRGLRAWVGFRQTGIPYVRPERMFGVSTNNWRKNIGWAKKAIFSFSFAPLEIVSYAGFTLTGVALLGIIWQVFARFILPDPPKGISTVIILVLFFGGVNLLALSFIGEYIAKIFEETKKRPKFIRTRIRRGSKTYTTDSEIKTLVEQLKK